MVQVQSEACVSRCVYVAGPNPVVLCVCVWTQDLSKTLLLYTVPAVQGFFRSISLSRGNNLQDTLR